MVKNVQRQVGTYHVRLPWGARPYTPYSGIKVAIRSSMYTMHILPHVVENHDDND